MFYSLIVAFPSAIFLGIWIWRILKWSWLKPRKMEKLLREEGFHGKSYRFLFGDVKEKAKMDFMAKTKPFPFTNDIVPRVIPFILHILQTFGNNFSSTSSFFLFLFFIIFDKDKYLMPVCFCLFV